MKYYKVLNTAMTRCGYLYKVGENDLRGHLDEDGKPMVCYFTDSANILRYADYGPILCGVKPKWGSVYAPENLYGKDGYDTPGWYSDRLWLSKPMKLWTVEIFDKLLKDGAKFLFDNYHLFKLAIIGHPEVFQYLMDVVKLQKDVYVDVCEELSAGGFI